jgi:MFS family permease
MPTPPDGGWGWVIVTASFIINLIADGVAFSFGVLFVELHEQFQDGRSKISWIGSVFFAIPLLAGPISSAMINKYGCRRTCIAGGIISTIGCVLSMFANSSVYLCITFGVISGLGLSFVYTPTVVIVAFYFEKKRAFATGLSVSGSGIGTFAIAPLMEYLIKTYGWRGTFLLIGGFFLNVVVCGTLLRPLETSGQRKRRKFLQSLDRLSRTSRNNSQLNIGVNEDTVKYIAVQFNGRRESATVVKIKKTLYEPVTHSLVQLPTYFYKDDNIPPKGSSSEAHVSGKVKVTFRNTQSDINDSETSNQRVVPFIQVESASRNGHLSADADNTENGKVCKNVIENGDIREHSTSNNVTDNRQDAIDSLQADIIKIADFDKNSQELYRSQSLKEVQTAFSDNLPQASANGDLPSTSSAQLQTLGKRHATLRQQPHQKHSNLDRFLPMYRRDIFYRGSLIRLDEFIQNKSSSCPQLYKASDPVSDDETDDRMFTCCQWRHAKLVIKEMLDISIFRSVKYILFFLSNFVLYTWYDVPYFYLPDYSALVGVSDEKASMAIAVIGIANMFGQIFFGVIADSPKVNSSLTYGISMLLCGISNLFYPLCTTFMTISINSVIFGFFIGANYSLCSIIIVEILSLDKLTNAYGIMMCGQGLANLIGPPFAGNVYLVEFLF